MKMEIDIDDEIPLVMVKEYILDKKPDAMLLKMLFGADVWW